MKTLLAFCFLLMMSPAHALSPIEQLMERIDKGASRKFVVEKVNSQTDFFELDRNNDKVVIRGNNYISMATGLNWYLKYYLGVHLSWNNMQAKLPAVLPPVLKKERRECAVKYRYDFNYCTFSYTMAFWDWKRWEKEIDWMALHGINIALANTGIDGVWHNLLQKLGYSTREINDFIAGPAFQAWWLMNNIEGWGGPNPESWYAGQIALQQKIIKRMHELGIEPVLPGYSGMVPHNAKEKMGLNVTDPGRWCSYRRPAFLQPTDPHFETIATAYYAEMDRLYGKAKFYSMDPFHEGGNTAGVDLNASGMSIMNQMKKGHPDAKWVIMAWQANPREQMIENLKVGDMLIIDLFSESRPQWGDDIYSHGRKNGFGRHEWVFSMLLNYGGNVGLHGKIEHVVNSYYKAKSHPLFGKTLSGTGLTMEGSENNPMMFELFSELAWRNEPFDPMLWLEQYTTARYGREDETVKKAWNLLARSIYNAPPKSLQQGTHESVFCARPALDVYQVSSWSEMSDYYEPDSVIKAAELMVSVADQFRGNNNFEYDLVDIVRQAMAEKGRLMLKSLNALHRSGDEDLYQVLADRFLQLILLQDELLSTRREFKVGNWINQARNKGITPAEKDLYEWNARVQITTWGNRTAAEAGGLRDYAHREWSGLLKDVYYVRWKAFFDNRSGQPVDYYAMDEAWTKKTNYYDCSNTGDCIDTVIRIFRIVFDK